MPKGSRKKRKARGQQAASDTPSGQGFDLGALQRVMAVTDIDFNQHLVDAQVAGCAYGWSYSERLERSVPTVTLITERPEELRLAFDSFQRWGADEDGDAVDVHMLLRMDGSYELWMGPNAKRAAARLLPHHHLCSPITAGIYWIKRLDSTSSVLLELKEYLESGLAPVVIDAAIGSARSGPSDIRPAGVRPFLKFHLEIIAEWENPSHRLLRNTPPDSHLEDAAQSVAKQRRKVVDVAFPVTKHRVLHSGLADAVRDLTQLNELGQYEVMQAACNLQISYEMCDGQLHFPNNTVDLQAFWDHVWGRVERADGALLPAYVTAQALAQQVDLDIRASLRAAGVPTKGEPLRKLFRLYMRKGLSHD